MAKASGKRDTLAPDPRLPKLRGAVQAARRAHGLGEDDYRALMQSVTGKASSTTCTAGELMRVLDVLNGKAGGAPAGRGRPIAEGEIPAKIRALVLNLHHLGAWPDPTEASITAFARRQTGIDDLRWITAAHVSPVVEALRAMCAREGLDVRPGMATAAAEAALARAQFAKLTRLQPDAAACWRREVEEITDADASVRRRVIRAMGAAIRGGAR